MWQVQHEKVSRRRAISGGVPSGSMPHCFGGGKSQSASTGNGLFPADQGQIYWRNRGQPNWRVSPKISWPDSINPDWGNELLVELH
jgi:hypothetical protein